MLAADVAAGTAIRPTDVILRFVPESLVPDHVLARTDSVVGTVARVDLTKGQMVTRGLVGLAGGDPASAVAGKGTVMLAVPTSGDRPAVRVGMEVAVLSLADPVSLAETFSGAASPPSSVAARVVGVKDESLTLAVDTRELATVTAFLRAGPVTVAVRGR